MRDLVRILRQGLVVVGARGVGVEANVELVLPTEVEARPREGVVAHLRGRMALGEIARMGGDAVGDDAHLHIVPVGQAQMLLGGDVAEHGATEPADHRRANARGDVVIARRDVGR